MDIVTHATSGALLALALPRLSRWRWSVPFFALVALAPDADILFSTNPFLFLNLHRGITHSLAYLPLLALLLTLPAFPLWSRKRTGALSFRTVWLLVCLCLGMHIMLDCLTSFGTMIFLPFSDLRVRLNALFIVDVLYTLPLVLLLVWGLASRFRRRVLGLAGLAWLAVYPGTCLALHAWNTSSVQADLAGEGRVITRFVLLPDFFSPFYWRALYVEQLPDGRTRQIEQSLSGLGVPRGPGSEHVPLPDSVAMHMAAQSAACRDFLHLMLMPVMEPLSERNREAALTALSFLPPEDLDGDGKPDRIGERRGHGLYEIDEQVENRLQLLQVHDLRFGSGLEIGRRLLAMRPRAGRPFRLMVVLDKDDDVLVERMVFSDIRKDSGWLRPFPPSPQTFGRWLLGLR